MNVAGKRALLPLLVILASCASLERTPEESAIREAEYNDRFILNTRGCEAEGGNLVLAQRITTRPMRNGIPDPGTQYYCARR